MNTLKLLQKRDYCYVPEEDPLPFYFWPVIGSLYRKRLEMCLEECQKGNRVLEVGFGSGISFITLSSWFEEIHGVDSTANIEDSTELFRKMGIPVKLQRGSVTRLNYPDHYFDSILAVSILEHLKPWELELAFREMKRVLKPGGQLIYGVPIDNSFMNTAFFLLLRYSITHHHFSSHTQIKEKAMEKFLKIRERRLSLLYEVCHFQS